MSRGTRSKVASVPKSTDDTSNDDDYDNVEDRSSPSVSRNTPSDSSLFPQGLTLQGSNILNHNFGF